MSSNLSENMISVPIDLLGGLEPYLLLEFYDFPYLTVDKTVDDSFYLNYYISTSNDFFKRALIKISREKLKSFLSGELSLRDCYDTPENNLVFIAEFNKAGKPVSVNLVKAQDYKSISEIPINYELDVEVKLEEEPLIDLKIKSEQLHKILVDIRLEAISLKSNLKYWAIKQFLLPYTELIRSTLIKTSPEYTQQSMDKYLDIGYNRLAFGSLISTIELNFNSNLFNDSNDYDRISNLFSVLNANDEMELMISLDKFEDRKIIFDYLKVLKTIIKKDAKFRTTLAAPNKHSIEVEINKEKAQKIKKIIDEKLPNVEDVEEVQGKLMELSYRNQKPTFVVLGTIDDIKYVGKIDEAFAETITENKYQFLSKEYIFTIKIVYSPPTSTSSETIQNTLLNIKDLT